MAITLAVLAAILTATLILRPHLHNRLRRELAPERSTDGERPQDFGLPAEECWLRGHNGKQLFAWHAAQPSADNQKQQALTTVILLHGWGGNASHLLPLGAALHAAGYGVLLLESRNHGRSDEDSFSSMPRFAEDLGSAIDWLHKTPATPPRQIALIGHSVGAAAALLSASRRRDLAAVVSIAAFAHPESIMRRFLAARRIPFIPFGWYALRYVERTIGHRFDQIAPENTIRKTACPVLLVHGLEDDTVPPDDARHLLACSNRARLLLLAGDHERFADIDTGISAVVEFLDEATGRRKTATTA
ncbi:MAG: alpha/beta fold hydrolase [Zoogloeaceae bacterium]|nr:alpha/beta fold hydrolase [Zoogloeaceae bacterium]